MNYLIGSGGERGAMAIEAMRGFSGFFADNDPSPDCVVHSSTLHATIRAKK